eukprot:Pgem_evm2s13333
MQFFTTSTFLLSIAASMVVADPCSDKRTRYLCTEYCINKMQIQQLNNEFNREKADHDQAVLDYNNYSKQIKTKQTLTSPAGYGFFNQLYAMLNNTKESCGAHGCFVSTSVPCSEVALGDLNGSTLGKNESYVLFLNTMANDYYFSSVENTYYPQNVYDPKHNVVTATLNLNQKNPKTNVKTRTLTYTLYAGSGTKFQMNIKSADANPKESDCFELINGVVSLKKDTDCFNVNVQPRQFNPKTHDLVNGVCRAQIITYSSSPENFLTPFVRAGYVLSGQFLYLTKKPLYDLSMKQLVDSQHAAQVKINSKKECMKSLSQQMQGNQ